MRKKATYCIIMAIVTIIGMSVYGITNNANGEIIDVSFDNLKETIGSCCWFNCQQTLCAIGCSDCCTVCSRDLTLSYSGYCETTCGQLLGGDCVGSGCDLFGCMWHHCIPQYTLDVCGWGWQICN